MTSEIIELGMFAATFIAAIGAAASAIANFFSASAARTAAEAARGTVEATHRSAEETRRAAEATKQGNLAQNMSAIIDEYRSQRMRDDLKLLADLSRQEGENLLIVWRARRWSPEIHDRADVARRNIYWFYRKCWELEASGLLPADFFDGFIRRNDGYAVVHELVVPMSAALKRGAQAGQPIEWADAMKAKYPPDPMS